MTRLPVYILAGGRSSRFGSDKARAVIGGQPLLRRLADAVAPAASAITVVADTPGKYHDLNLRTITDRLPGRGPLGGLHAAICDMQEPGWLLLLSCDILTFNPAWIQQLLGQARPDTHAVAFKPDARWQPLLALYHARILPAVKRQLDQPNRAMQRLLDNVNPIACTIPGDWPTTLQANTPQQLQQHRVVVRGIAAGA